MPCATTRSNNRAGQSARLWRLARQSFVRSPAPRPPSGRPRGCERPAAAAATGENAAKPPAVVVPGFWNPRRRPERPDLSRVQTIRFLTDVDYPPFDYAGADGNPAGFNVDLARLICDEIKISCTIQARPFGTLLDALNDNRGDAVIASIAPTAKTTAAPISPIPITARRRASSPAPTARSATCCRSGSRAGKSPSLPAPPTKPTSRRCLGSRS